MGALVVWARSSRVGQWGGAWGVEAWAVSIARVGHRTSWAVSIARVGHQTSWAVSISPQAQRRLSPVEALSTGTGHSAR